MNSSVGRKLFDRKMIVLLLAQLLVGVVVVVTILLLGSGKSGSPDRAEFFRKVGNKLQAAGVVDQAVAYYEKYLKKGQLSDEQMAKMAYQIANLLEEQGELAKSLSWYYQVDLLESSSENAVEARKRIVAILTRMDKYSAAKFALASSTGLDKDKVKQGGTVVAKIGSRPIYLHQVQDSLDMLPESLRKQFEGKEGKQQLVRKFVADELFLLKATNAGYDKDPKVVKQLQQIEKQLLVQKMIEEEVGSKISVDESDLKNYFEANKKRYSSKKKKDPAFKDVRQQVEMDYRMEKGQALYGQAMDKIMKTEKVELFLDNL